MISTKELEKIERLLTRLPFHLDEVGLVNSTYVKWKASGQEQDQVIVDIWTYCFVWRNLLVKFSRNPELNPADFDMLVANVFERIVDRRDTIRDENRYANWVSVVCRNIFINHVRSLKKRYSLNEKAYAELVAEPEEFGDDLMVLHRILLEAINRLPGYLQEVARLRIIEQKSYEDISEEMGRKIEVVRSYVNKAMRRLRNDAQLRKVIKREFREDIEN